MNVAYWLHGRENQSIGRFAELQLLHDNPGTATSYEDFYCTDDKGKHLQQIGVLKDGPLSAKPLSEKRISLSLDKQLLAMVSDAENRVRAVTPTDQSASLRGPSSLMAWRHS